MFLFWLFYASWGFADHVKIGVDRSLHAPAISLCSSKINLDSEMKNIFKDFQANDYSKKVIKKCVNVLKKSKQHEEKMRGKIIILYLRSVSEKL